MPPWCTNIAVVATLLGSACGATAKSSPPPVLPTAAVPYLPSSSQPLTALDLTREIAKPGLAKGLASWGFVVGAERTFQGQSRRLQVVVSRTLVFRTPSGAVEYVGFVHRHAAAQFGAPPSTQPLHSGGRTGWVFRLAACACHMASPALVGVGSRGDRVTWLEINGPTATLSTLVRLLAKAP